MTDVPPLSAAAQAALESRPQINLDDIFGDCFFTPDGEAVFLNDSSESVRSTALPSSETTQSVVASKPTQSQNGEMAAVSVNAPPLGKTQTGSTLRGEGFIAANDPQATTNVRAKIMSSAPPAQQMHHMKFISRVPAPVDDKKRKMGVGVSNVNPMGRSNERKMSEQQKVERRCV